MVINQNLEKIIIWEIFKQIQSILLSSVEIMNMLMVIESGLF